MFQKYLNDLNSWATPEPQLKEYNVNASYSFTQFSYLVKTYTTTAQEPSIYNPTG